MPKFPVLPAKELLRLLIKYGCQLVGVRGSHHKVFNPVTGKTSIVAIHSGQDVSKHSFASVLSQLGIDADEFLTFIKSN